METSCSNIFNASQALERNDFEEQPEYSVNSPDSVREAIDNLETDYLHIRSFHSCANSLLRILHNEENILRGILGARAHIDPVLEEEFQDRIDAFDDPTLPWPPTGPKVAEKMRTYLSLAAREVESALEHELDNMAPKLRKYKGIVQGSMMDESILNSYEGPASFSLPKNYLHTHQSQGVPEVFECCEQEISKIGVPYYMPAYEEPLTQNNTIDEDSLFSQEVRQLIDQRFWADAVYQLFNDYLIVYNKVYRDPSLNSTSVHTSTS